MKIRISDRKRLLFFLFCIYILLLFKITVFRSGFLKGPFFCGDINLVLFADLIKIAGNNLILFFYYAIGNIIWFLPLGFFIPLIDSGKKAAYVVFCGFLTSFTIEFLQYALSTGISELDDIVLNTLGSALGYCLFSLIKKRSSIKKGLSK